MKLVVMLVTSNRPELTKRTLETYNAHLMAPSDVELIEVHVDDVSDDHRNSMLAKQYRFNTLIETRERLGANRMRAAGLERVRKLYDPTHILVLENDWEFVKRLWLDEIKQVFDQNPIWAFRLYGKHKQADLKRPAGAKHAGRNNADPNWADITSDIEMGDIHWGAPPCICQAKWLYWLHEDVKRDKQAMLKSGKIAAKTARVKDNIVWHIGDERTPGFTG